MEEGEETLNYTVLFYGHDKSTIKVAAGRRGEEQMHPSGQSSSSRNKHQQLIGYPGTMWMENPLVRDAGAAVLTGLAVAVVLRFWEEVANRALLEQVNSVLCNLLSTACGSNRFEL